MTRGDLESVVLVLNVLGQIAISVILPVGLQMMYEKDKWKKVNKCVASGRIVIGKLVITTIRLIEI